MSYVRRINRVTGPRYTKHAVAAGLDDDFMLSSLDCGGRNDVLDATVAAISSRDALEGGAVRGEDHGLAARIKLN